MRGEVGATRIGPRQGESIPQTGGSHAPNPLLGDHNERPPEPGFARREAHYAAFEVRPPRAAPETRANPGRSQGGGTRGNQGFPRARTRGSPTLLTSCQAC